MLKPGTEAELKVGRRENNIAWLEHPEGEVALPGAPEEIAVGTTVKVCLYHDREGRLTASLRKPLALAGEFAVLRVVSVTPDGAFLDMGLPRDLFVPEQEIRNPLAMEDMVTVRLYHDRVDGRLVGSTKIERFLSSNLPGYRTGAAVQLLIREATDLGFKVIVDNRYDGLLYRNEVFEKLNPGDRRDGYVKKVRDDGKLDVSLRAPGYGKVEGVTGKILAALEKNDGFLPVTDKSPPEEIRRLFGESKKSFKMAVGTLYREKKIRLEEDGIRLTSP